jgi:hypothetical protein
MDLSKNFQWRLDPEPILDRKIRKPAANTVVTGASQLL